MKNLLAIVALIVVVAAVVGVVAYSAGQSYGETQAQNIRSEFFQSRSGTGGTSGQSGQGGTAAQGTNTRNQAGRPVASGSIKSVEGNTIQLTQQDGTSVTVNLSGQTVIEKVTVGAASDLQMGQRVSVQGTETNGQVAATLIQITASGQ